ncbi:hypothetical protein L345_08206, partial [Ophiophagus hannah]
MTSQNIFPPMPSSCNRQFTNRGSPWNGYYPQCSRGIPSSVFAIRPKQQSINETTDMINMEKRNMSSTQSLALGRKAVRICPTAAQHKDLSNMFEICSIFHAQWKQLIQNNLPHLCRTNEEIPLQCIYELTDFNFPLEVLEVTNRDSADIIYELLQQISYLLSNAHAWNSTCFENLKNGLHQQIKNLETCLNVTEMPKGLMNCDEVPPPFRDTNQRHLKQQILKNQSEIP